MKTTTVNLRADAEREARRLAAARAIACNVRRSARAGPTNIHAGPHGGVAAPCGPLIARARGARRRQTLGGRLLFIWQVGCEDGSGRPAAAAIVAMLVHVTASAVDAGTRLRDLVEQIGAEPPAAIERVLAARTREVVESCRAHARARLERERAIAAWHAAPARGTPVRYQAGLFDRRSERAHRERAADADEAEDVARARVLAAEAAAAAAPGRPRLLLVLVPFG